MSYAIYGILCSTGYKITSSYYLQGNISLVHVVNKGNVEPVQRDMPNPYPTLHR